MWMMLLLAEVAATSAPLPSFLTGCWEQRQGDRWTEECWTSPRGGLMLGSGRDGSGDAVGQDAEVSLADGSKPVRWSYRRTGRPTGE